MTLIIKWIDLFLHKFIIFECLPNYRWLTFHLKKKMQNDQAQGI